MIRHLLVLTGTWSTILGVAAADVDSEQKACERDDGSACVALAMRHVKGDGVPKNVALAKQLALKACAKKTARGCTVAGLLVQATDQADAARVVALLEQGCALGDGSACNDLGTIWASGKPGSTGVDFTKSSKLYLRACTLKDAVGCFNAGNVYRLGEGAKLDLKTAAVHFQRACDLGSSSGCSAIGTAYATGAGVEKDSAKALALYERACTLGADKACEAVAASKAASKR
ncbi:MAG: sel1 repeat family protein [Myxococcales bacterium]|nr:sel1 repeat family protein [Myxococcales bacterium]